MRFRPVFTWKALAALAFAAALLAGSLSAVPQDDSDRGSKARIVRLSYVTGQVQISRPEEDDWENALANMPIQEGYAIATGRGRAEIEFESGATVRLDENTEVQFNEMRLLDGNRVTRMTLSQGTAIFYANLARNDEFTVLTPGVQVTIPRNSRFRMDVTSKHVNVAVLKGDVTVETQAGNYKLTKGKALLFDTRGGENAIVARAADPDEFERWAADRDDTLNSSRSASLHYVSAPFRYGMGDLSRHGSWVYAAPYGYVWQPWGVYAGWSPYYDGRWIYVRGYGWTWVSYEPWGWLPYHYGSWVHVRGGWGWVPGSLHRSWWHPGLVVWVNLGGGRHGWCPRNPFDRPGRIYHNTTINNTIIVNTNTGIIGGGRNERFDRRGRGNFTYSDDRGQRDRDFFGNYRELRREAGIVTSTTDGGRFGGENSGPTGRTGDRFGRGDGSTREGGAPSGTTTTGVGSGFSGRTDNTGRRFDSDTNRPTGRIGEQTDTREGRGLTRTDPDSRGRVVELEDTREGRGFSGRRPAEVNATPDTGRGVPARRRPNFGNPDTPVEYDPSSRRFENRPTQPAEVEDRSMGVPERLRPGTFGNRSDSQERLRPGRNDNSGERGTFGGSQPPTSEPRPRYNEPRPEPRPQPRYEPRNEPRPEPRNTDNGSRGGGWGGGRSESPRPSPPPSSGGGGWGGGGGRPSSPPPSPPPAPRPSGGDRPQRPRNN